MNCEIGTIEMSLFHQTAKPWMKWVWLEIMIPPVQVRCTASLPFRAAGAY
jgi:hypothetical protein